METYRVRCEDGAYRHPQAFGTMDEARQFAEWGHACTAAHRIEPTSQTPGERFAARALSDRITLLRGMTPEQLDRRAAAVEDLR